MTNPIWQCAGQGKNEHSPNCSNITGIATQPDILLQETHIIHPITDDFPNIIITLFN